MPFAKHLRTRMSLGGLDRCSTKVFGSVVPYRQLTTQRRSLEDTIKSPPPSVTYAPFLPAQASKPNWKPALAPIPSTQNPKPDWQLGDGATGANAPPDIPHVEIDPFAPGRPMRHNYSLLVSGIVPRPIAFTSTLSADGRTANLAPFSYFQVVEHDPPVFVLGFSGRTARPKDTLANLQATGECVVNMISENFIEAAVASATEIPVDASEWTITGLNPAPSATVKPARVKEAIFSIECKLLEIVDFKTSNAPVGEHGCLAVLEATRFWVREDALDNEKRKIDINVLRPVGQLGGASYARITETFQLPRIPFTTREDFPGREALNALENKSNDKIDNFHNAITHT